MVRCDEFPLCLAGKIPNSRLTCGNVTQTVTANLNVNMLQSAEKHLTQAKVLYGEMLDSLETPGKASPQTFYCVFRVEPQDKMKDSLRRESVVDIQDDGDPYWFNNPQYRLSTDEPVEVG